MGEEGGSWRMLMMKTPRFSTIILDNSATDEKLCLPKLFTTEYGALFPDKVILKLPSGAEWQVGLLKSAENIWFQEGWQRFAELYGLASGHLLVFEYSSHGHFLVLIFDKTATEINYLTHEANVGVGSKYIIEISDDSSDDRCPSFEARGKLALRAPQPTKRQRRRNECGTSVGRTSEAMFCRGSTSRVEDNPNQKRSWTSQKGKSLTAEERANALARAISDFQSQNPYFMIVMQPSYLGAGMRLYLPIDFAETNLEEKCGDFELQLPGGRAWMVKYLVVNACSNRKRAMFESRGWGQFARDNSLRVGDVCVFELVEGCAKPRLKVVIFRAPQDGNRCSSPPRLENRLNDVKPNRTSHSVSPGGHMSKSSKHEECDRHQQSTTTRSGHVEAASAFTSKSNQPCFRVIVAPSHLDQRRMSIPQAFSNHHIEEACDKAELRFAHKCWIVRIRRASKGGVRQHKYLGSGWGAFAAWNRLEVGDVCVFELIKGEDDDASKKMMVLDVHIFRA